jgi:cell division protein FtsA
MTGRKRKNTKYVMGLDVGTTKVCAIIGQQDDDSSLSVLGVGSTPSLGLKKGIVIDTDQTVESIQKAVQKASNIAGVEMHDLVVGIAGGHIQCHNSRASVEIVNPSRGVTRSDIVRVNSRAKALAMPVDREILHSIPQEYVTDSGPVKNPKGQVTTKLEVNVHIVTAAVTSVQNLMRCVKQAGYNTNGILLESIASSEAILHEEEKELGVLLIDLGGGTTDIAIFSRGHIRYSGVIPLGGDNITNDIAYILKISLFDAENVKKKYGCAMASLTRPEEIFTVTKVVNDKKETVKRQELADIIEARLEEIFHLVRERINATSVHDKFYAGVVITGGSALIEGITELGEKVFECPCRVGIPHGLKGMTSVVSSPIYATGIGLMRHGFTDALNQPPDGNGLYDWIQKNLLRLLSFFK